MKEMKMRKMICLLLVLSGCATPASSGRAFCSELRSNTRLASSLARAALIGAGVGGAIAVPSETPSEARLSSGAAGVVLLAIAGGLYEYASDAKDERDEFCARHASTSSTARGD
jgi:hypothetical protein